MQFVFQPLTWGFLLVLVPLIAHLINLLRHRRTKWAAMDFLLESYRKHRRWVWMKQLLLLLSRMAIMALLVLLLAQWVTGARWLSIFGQTVTHHYILLDDSQSMADSVQGASAYQAGLKSISSLLSSFADDQGSHQVTILRYSRALALEAIHDQSGLPSSKSVRSADTVADLLSRSIPTNPASLLEPLNLTAPVGLSLSPTAAIETIVPLVRNASDEQAIVYLVSDFRERDWRQSQSIRSALEPLKAAKVELQLIDCAPVARENLSVVSLQPDQEVLAAGVPVMMRVDIRNPGASAARNVNLTLKSFETVPGETQPRIDRYASGKETALPTLVLDSIPAGETVSRRFQVIFSNAGSHVVQAQLPDDPLLEDNSFGAVLDVVTNQQLLVIDGDESRRGAFFLNATLNPGGMMRTGWRPTTESPSFLRDTSAELLDSYTTMVLLNTSNLDQRALSNLEGYVSRGGGLALFVGGNLPQSDIDRINRDWYRNGQGILPAAIERVNELAPSLDGVASPDMLATNHPIFGPLLGLSNSPFQLVRVFQYAKFANTKPKETESEATLTRPAWQSILNLRDGSPLMIDHPFGKGRVIVLATALDPRWTTWPQDPTFVVGMLKTMGYLASFRTDTTAELVGTPIELTFSSREATADSEVILPGYGKNAQRQSIVMVASPMAEPMLGLRIAVDPASQNLEQTRALLSPGVTEVWTTALAGERRVKNFARNAPSQEGELKKIAASDLLAGLRPIEAKYRTAEALSSTAALAGMTNRQGLLLLLLLVLLLLEQFLAWSASYHLSAAKNWNSLSRPAIPK
jgi:uncharacterized membrane protein